VRSIRQGGFVCLLTIAIVGCSTEPTAPLNPPIQRPLTPTMDSIEDLFGVLHVDDIIGEAIVIERAGIESKLQAMRSKGSRSPAQEQVLNEFLRKALSLADEYMSIDQAESILAVVIRDSFSQQDVDAMAAFYRTKSGQALVAKVPAAMRAFAKQQISEREAARSSIGNSGEPASLPLSPHAFFKPWEDPGYSQFFATDIGRDIEARWPAAGERLAEESEKLKEPMRTRMLQLSVEYQAKYNAAGTDGNR
jgi:hypothetical protein